jgi:hypothetical protein
MTYSGTSELRGQGVASAASIDAWMQRKGQQLAAGYAPDGQYRHPPAVGEPIVRIAREVGYNADLIAAQIVKESAGWQSRIVRDKNNPSGLGAVNDNAYDGAITFATPEDGIRATVAHLRTYVEGQHPWWGLDPRADAVPARNLGSVRVLSDLDGKWAYPGVGYGAGVATLANDLVAFAAANPGQEQPMAAQIPGFEWAPAAWDHYQKGRTAAIRGGAQHYTAGTDSLNWLRSTSKPPVSVHFLVRHEPTMDRRGWQLVAIEDTAWTTANANPYTVAIEYEHTGAQTIPDAAYDVLAQTWIDVSRYVETQGLGAIRLDRTGIKGHKEWVGNPGLVCPDGIDVDRIVARIWQLQAGEQPQPEPQPDNPERRYFPETRHSLSHGFLRFWESSGGLAIFGYPLSEEFTDPDSGVTVQWFERARFEHQPTIAGNEWGVVLGRIGSESLERDREQVPDAFAPVES